MAKRKVVSKSAPAAETPTPALDSEVSRAYPVASIVNLENIVVEEFCAKRTAKGYTNNGDVNFSFTTEIGIGRDTGRSKLFVKIGFALKGTEKIAPEDSEPLIQINCRFVAMYAIPSFEGLNDDTLTAFAQTSGVFSVWPYWRQVVHTATLHLALPTIVFPTYRAGEALPAPPAQP
jgi:hypothetical protein